jgi:hypothetical protein
MNLNLNGFNSSIANSASVVAEINRQNEEMIRSIAEATQERLAREEKNGFRCRGEYYSKRAAIRTTSGHKKAKRHAV